MENKATLSKQDKEALDNAAIEFCQYADNVNEEFSFDDDAYPTFKSGAEWGILYGRNSIPSLQSEIDRLKEEKKNLVSVLTDFTAWCEYPDVSKILGMSQATIFHTAKDLLTRIK